MGKFFLVLVIFTIVFVEICVGHKGAGTKKVGRPRKVKEETPVNQRSEFHQRKQPNPNQASTGHLGHVGGGVSMSTKPEPPQEANDENENEYDN
uniref:Uncharacterized protein n=1 Tax=Meloidogyne enterolobii TaxID=390850 RepID=A0A6V7TWA3_MELEN|nr:unnamed protein product [Meloidogyne enterolobii]